MKIVIFSSDNNLSSGAFRAEINLIKDLKSKGNKVVLVLPYRWKGNKLAKNLGIQTKTILSIPWVCNKRKNIFSILAHWASAPINFLAYIRTKIYLKHHKFDLAVVNTVWNGVGGKAAIQNGIPTVWHLREILERGQNKRFYNQQKSYSIINKSKLCISVSNAVKTHYESNLKHVPIINIYDGIDMDVFYNNNKKLFTTPITRFLMLGIVKKPKGQHLGLTALNNLSNYNFDVKIVGKCSKAYKKELIKLIPNIKDRVEFIKPTQHPENWYQWADVFLMNSIGEAFGLVTAEAMAGGVSIVAAKCDGNLEIINDETNGYFYKPLDANDLQNKIEYVLSHKEETKLKAKKAQQMVANKFDKKLNSEAIIKEYLKCVNNK